MGLPVISKGLVSPILLPHPLAASYTPPAILQPDGAIVLFSKSCGANIYSATLPKASSFVRERSDLKNWIPFLNFFGVEG